MDRLDHEGLEGIEVDTPLLPGHKDEDDDNAKCPRVSAGITLFTAFVGAYCSPL